MKKAADIKSLLENATTKKTTQIKCYTCKWLATLDPDQAEAVQEAIYSGEWHMSVLADALRDAGFDIAKEGLTYHRRQKH